MTTSEKEDELVNVVVRLRLHDIANRVQRLYDYVHGLSLDGDAHERITMRFKIIIDGLNTMLSRLEQETKENRSESRSGNQDEDECGNPE